MVCPDGSTARRYDAVSLLERFVFCSMNGTSTFAISLVSAIQMHMVEKVCGANFTSEALRLHRTNLENYKRSMRASIFPVLEMIIFPTICVILHVTCALSALQCLIGCMALMSLTCVILRTTGKVSGCTSVSVPVYPNGYPFPAVSDGRCGTSDKEKPRNTHISVSGHKYEGPLSFTRALAVAFASIPFRIVTMAFSMVLVATKLLLLPVSIVYDAVLSVMDRKRTSNSADSSAIAHKSRSSEIARHIYGLACAVCYDVAWVLSLGLYGAGRIIYASNIPASAASKHNVGSGPMGGGGHACCGAKTTTSNKRRDCSTKSDYFGNVGGILEDAVCTAILQNPFQSCAWWSLM